MERPRWWVHFNGCWKNLTRRTLMRRLPNPLLTPHCSYVSTLSWQPSLLFVRLTDVRNSNERALYLRQNKGKWYATIATDGCNSTRYRPATSSPAPPPPPLVPCSAGGQLDLWTSDALRGPKANWRHVDTHPMFTSNRTALTGHGTTAIEGRELVIGLLPSTSMTHR